MASKVSKFKAVMTELRKPGLRHVDPYWQTLSTRAKMRWYDRPILDILVEEFRDRTKHYYAWAIRKGLLEINGKPAMPSQVIKNGDEIKHTTHRHEPAISNDPVRILHHQPEEGRLVFVKPGSVPVHSAGRYYKHSVLELLRSDHGFEKVYTANRLDRLTSGIMVAATNVAAAKSLSEDFATGRVRKAYVCRVKGRFPDGEIVCEEPLLSVDRQTGLVINHPEGRQAKTFFNRLSYDFSTDTSVLFCRPVTGRTHQIRVHAQLLGHPIPNDPIYAHKLWEHQDPRAFKNLAVPSTSATVTAAEAQQNSHSPASVSASSLKYLAEHPLCASIIEKLKNTKDEEEDWGRYRDELRFSQWNAEAGWSDTGDVNGINSDPAKSGEMQSNGNGIEAGDYCPECHLPLLPDPPLESLYIYLHAIRYETDQWSYEDEMPWWALEDWQSEGAIEKAMERRHKGQGIRPPKLRLFAEADEQSTSSSGGRAQTSTQGKDAYRYLLDYSTTAQKGETSPAIAQNQSAKPHPRTALRVFRGLEDFVAQDLRNRLAASQEDSVTTALHSAFLTVSSEHTASVIQGALPFAESKYIVLGSAQVPEELLDQLITDRLTLGTRTHKALARTAKRRGKGRKIKAESSDKTLQETASAEVERTPDGTIKSESELLDLISSLWSRAVSEGIFTSALSAWKSHCSDKPKEKWSYRTTIDRGIYKFPTLSSQQIASSLGSAIWKTVNGVDVGIDDPHDHAVNLTSPDLEFELAFAPWLTDRDFVHPAEGPLRLGDRKVSTTQNWERNPPGSLLLMLKVRESQHEMFSHRPPLDEAHHQMTEGGTTMARWRSYTLCRLLPLRALPPQEDDEDRTLRIWEPCAGHGSIAIELAQCLSERQLLASPSSAPSTPPNPAHSWPSIQLYASDVDSTKLSAAKTIATRSGVYPTPSSPSVSSSKVRLDLFLHSLLSPVPPSCIAPSSLDAILTDLPWGNRSLSHGQLFNLYVSFVEHCLATLKVGAVAVVLTIEVKSLKRAMREVEGRVRRGDASATAISAYPSQVVGEGEEEKDSGGSTPAAATAATDKGTSRTKYKMEIMDRLPAFSHSQGNSQVGSGSSDVGLVEGYEHGHVEVQGHQHGREQGQRRREEADDEEGQGVRMVEMGGMRPCVVWMRKVLL